MEADVKKRIVIAALMLTSVAACGKSASEQQAEEASKKVQAGAETVQEGANQMAEGAKQSSDQMAQGLQKMAQGLQQMAQGSTKSVDYEALKALLPDVDGWTKTNTRGEQLTMPVSYSRAETRYQKADSSIELEITDTALSQLLLAPMSMFLSSGYSERSDDGFKRAAKIGGMPGMEEWETGSKRGEVTAVVSNRFIVHGTGHDVESLDPVR
jgi:X-X-X-Leu-X-X-Gly heptad repeat protein